MGLSRTGLWGAVGELVDAASLGQTGSLWPKKAVHPNHGLGRLHFLFEKKKEKKMEEKKEERRKERRVKKKEKKT
jgi:hypothetical protein